ncbi:MAG: hypothetical protein JWO52_2379, partial [Gammaproteobacteria bacterium]|nr:hypothetical protein [Gammaproteobacteria bacterium]
MGELTAPRRRVFPSRQACRKAVNSAADSRGVPHWRLGSHRLARGLCDRAPLALTSSAILILRSARLLRLRAALPVWVTTTLASLLSRHALRRRHVLRTRCALRARRSLRMRRGLPTATELARLARPLRRVVLLIAHLVLLVHVRLWAASSFAVSGSTARCSAT